MLDDDAEFVKDAFNHRRWQSLRPRFVRLAGIGPRALDKAGGCAPSEEGEEPHGEVQPPKRAGWALHSGPLRSVANMVY